MIVMTGNGVYNITPVNRKNVKYRLGAAGAKEKDLELVKESNDMNENKEVERITKIGKSMKVGDKTTFGVITKMGDDWTQFKAKDTPKTKIKFNQRKSGGRYVLSLLALAEEEIKEHTSSFGEKNPFSSNNLLVDAARKILKGECEE